MYKQVMLLGLLLERPMYGQQIREVIEQHHDFLADHIKKPTIYYQLERLVKDGYLEVRREAVEAPGPGAAHDELAPREREVYYITSAGRQRFSRLLRSMLSSYTPGLSEVDACLFFLHHLTSEEAVALLRERLKHVTAYRESVERQMEEHGVKDAAHRFVNEHTLALLDAEIQWLERTIQLLSTPAEAGVERS
ncbi:MAG TPA: PadR family transcriptional regulator [Ktedonobacteraceae bacterium]|nr:PadR family transcriptional regulator [Ktedonobacteraceae bacterium]